MQGETVVQLQGNPDDRYFNLGPIIARRLGLAPHPDYPHALVLDDEPEVDVSVYDRVYLPNGEYFTVGELTMLSHKSGNEFRGWELWVDDPGGCSSSDLREPADGVAS